MTDEKKKTDNVKHGAVEDAELASRRTLIGTGAAAALGLLIGACGDDDDGTGDHDHDGAGTGGAGGTGGSKAGAGGTGGSKAGAGGAGGSKAGAGGTGGSGGSGEVDADIEQLNALLSAEYTAITAYSAGAGLINSAADDDKLKSLATVIVSIATDIQSQHKLHAEALVDAIDELKGKPVKEADVAKTFKPPTGLTDNPTITNVLKFAASAERGAAIAYNQVLAKMENAKYRFLASSIEGDETQHFIVLAALVLGLADPGPELKESTTEKVFPAAFVSTVGDVDGLDKGPADYFA